MIRGKERSCELDGVSLNSLGNKDFKITPITKKS